MRAQLPRFTAYLILVIGMLVCRAGYLDGIIYNVDEAEYAVAADALNHGWLPGVDLLGSTKPPGIAILYNLLFHIFGRSMSVIHVAHLIIMILAGCFVTEIARQMWGDRAMVPTAVMFWIGSNTFNLPPEIVAMNVESPGLLFAVFGLWILGRNSDRAWTFLTGGLALGIAILFRQSFLFFVVPALYLVFIRRSFRDMALFAVAALLPWLPILAVYVARGDMEWIVDSWIRYPLTYSSDLGWIGFLFAAWGNAVEFARQEFPILLLCAVGLITWWKMRRTRNGIFLLLLAVASGLALASGSRFFGHYWIQTFPVLALLAVAGWMALASGKKSARYALAILVMIGALLAVRRYPLWHEWDPYAVPKGVSPYCLTQSQMEITLGTFARENTAENETVVVWGYCPQIYYHANRLPGVRDYLCHYTTGYSPATFYPMYERAVRPYGHPRAQEMFVEDLKARRPRYILDISEVANYEFPFVQYPITLYPLIAEYVRANYVPDRRIEQAFVYRLRKDTSNL